MQISFEQLKTITRGVSFLEETEKGVVFHRFSKAQEKAYRELKTDAANARASFCSGVRLAFRTDSKELTIKGTVETILSQRLLYCFDLLINGVLCDTLSNMPDDFDPHDPKAELPLGDFNKTFLLGSGEKTVELYFPWSTKVYLKEITVDDGARVIPHKYPKTLICFGDSITQGYDSTNASCSYASILSRALNAEIFNRAIGGEVFFPELAAADDIITDPDYITVAYGTNDFSKKEPAVFRKNCREFYSAISKKHPNSKIFAISPIYRKAYKTHSTTKFSSFFEIEEGIKAAIEKLDNVSLIEGFDLIPHDDELFSDRSVHPTNEGFSYYGKNLSNKILSLI